MERMYELAFVDDNTDDPIVLSQTELNALVRFGLTLAPVGQPSDPGRLVDFMELRSTDGLDIVVDDLDVSDEQIANCVVRVLFAAIAEPVISGTEPASVSE